MILARAGQGLLGLALLASCAAPPPDSDRDQSIVITKHAHSVDFPKFRTFFLRPEIRTLDDAGELTPVDSAKAQPLLDATTKNLTARGFTAVGKDQADLAVEMFYTEHISNTYWCYSWFDPYYWGYPAWGYYPYYDCGAVSWKSNMLSTTISDLTVASGGGSAGGEGGGGGQSSEPGKIPGVWFSGIYGIAITAPQAIDGINQAFAQSPYIRTVP